MKSKNKVPRLKMFLVDKDGSKVEVNFNPNWDAINCGCMNHDKEPFIIRRIKKIDK
jgi:hypothetical protein